MTDDGTPLMEAIGGDWSSPTAVRVLLALGADANLASEDGLTPIMIAADQSCIESINLLVSAGAKLRAVDSEGVSAIDRARSQVDIWKEIISKPTEHQIEGLPHDENRPARHTEALRKAEHVLRLLESSPTE